MQPNTTPLYIFDIDGTLCNIEHRLHYLQTKNWDGFYKACVDDEPNTSVIQVMNKLLESGADIYLFSARSEVVREETIQWLSRYTYYPMHELRNNETLLTMRRDRDYTEDHILKESWLNFMLEEDINRLVGVFDDRQRVVDMWRSRGITCFQVAAGEF